MLADNGIEYKKVNYYEEKLSASKLKQLLKKLDIPAKDLLRKTEKVYKELELAKKDYSDSELIQFMVENPDLIQRPIVEKGEKAVIGRPTENIDSLLN